MCLYDYKCSSCGHVQEVAHPMNDNPDVKCDVCDGTANKTFLTVKFQKFYEGSTWEESHNRVR